MRAWKQLSTNLPLEKGMKLVEDEPYPLAPTPNQVLARVKKHRGQPSRSYLRRAGSAGEMPC